MRPTPRRRRPCTSGCASRQPGSTTFGPRAWWPPSSSNSGRAPLHANDFRIATYPEERREDGHGQAAGVRRLGRLPRQRRWRRDCEEPAVKLRYSDDLARLERDQGSVRRAATTTSRRSRPTRAVHRLAVAWFTNRFDRVSTTGRTWSWPRLGERPRQEADAADASVERARGRSAARGAFIGDYIEVSPSTAARLSPTTPTTGRCHCSARGSRFPSRTTTWPAIVSNGSPAGRTASGRTCAGADDGRSRIPVVAPLV